jgi:L-iditol 2-dehydrogenase
MRVAELVERHRFALTESSIEEPGPGEVQARVYSVGVCGSDLHNFSEGSIGDAPAVYPMVLGHEPTGVVTKVGPGVTGWSPGDRVMLEPAIYCYHCEFCRSGHHNVCANLRFMSQPRDPGYFRDFVVVPVESLVPIPEGMGDDYATLFEPLAVALHSLKFAAVTIGDTVAVFGAGPVGLLTIASLKLSGASRIIAVEPVKERRELARTVGASETIDPHAVNPRTAIAEATGKRGVDIAMDCVTREGTIDHCLDVVRYNGRVVVTGIPPEPRVTLDYHVMRRKEIHLFNVRRSNHETEAAVEMMKLYPELFAPVVTHSKPLEEIQEAFELNEAFADGVGKMVIRVNG